MSLSLDERRKVAESLLRIKAIQLAPESPFTWASGLRSPIYCDNRMALSHPAVRTHIRQQLCAAVESRFGKPDMISSHLLRKVSLKDPTISLKIL